jgi:invasion protein IalB
VIKATLRFLRNLMLPISMLVMLTAFAAGQAPQKTSATYEDWTVSCSRAADRPKTCELIQIQTLEGQSAAASQVTIGRLEKDGPLKLVIQVAPNVSLDAGLKFTSDEKEPALPATFRWCTNTRCLAERDLSADAAAKLRKITEPGKLEYKEANQRDVVIPVSFKGFAPAYDLLLKESADAASVDAPASAPAAKSTAKK